MAWELTTDVERFAATTGEFLRSEPVRHTVFLTLIETLRSRGQHAYGPTEPYFGWWSTPADQISGVLIHTPPYPVMFTEVPPEAVPAAVEALATRSLAGANQLAAPAVAGANQLAAPAVAGANQLAAPAVAGANQLAARAVAGANLPAADVDAFAAGWQERTGTTARPGMRTRLFRLDTLVPPHPAPAGAARSATAADRPLVIDWLRAFHEFINEEPPDLGTLADERLESGGVTLWENEGVPVSMAIRSHPAAGMVRVQFVYTPPEHRGRGFAAGATAAASRAALDAGATDVVLFTDLANPTSNALYPRLGYRPIEDRAVVEFS
ncbi:GNAT family N-acetyltransferase [Actinoplanes sp. GCM10030250]|uniref:GNAT family N-acetyltransferase n=1 Tax=Actinoplanes sp. GCM10030250 TaxID=3273376 RepID=UPI00360BD46E